MPTIFKHGNEANLPTLVTGEPAICLDTGKLYIGNILINPGETDGDQTYTHTQSIPSSQWVIQLPEGFKKYPSVTITDSAGTVVHGGVQYTELTNTVTLTFTAAFSGKAHFN